MTPEPVPLSVKSLFDGLPHHWLLMVESQSTAAKKTVQEIVSYHLSNKSFVVLLSASRPCYDIHTALQEQGISHENLLVLCSVCTNDSKSVGNTLHLKQRQSLTEESIAVGVIARQFKNKRAVFIIDSLPTLLMYHPPAIIARFMHNILVQFQREQMNGVVFSLKGAVDTTVREEIAQLCDNVVSL